MFPVKTVTMHKDWYCSRCGFKMSKGSNGYDVGEGKIVCSVCFIMLKKK
jgi:formylmethanofuran dehydrogenase subunit E